MASIAEKFVELQEDLSNRLRNINFQPPVAEVLHPMYYAHDLHSEFVNKYLKESKSVLVLGINPGRHSSAQTGVAFGDVDTVRNWFTLTTDVDYVKVQEGRQQAPNMINIVGGLNYDYDGDESGRRFWTAIWKIYGTPEEFFKSNFVYNYCPVAMFDKSQNGVTPDNIHDDDKEDLEKLCDDILGEIIKILNVKIIVALGRYPEERANAVLREIDRQHIRVEYVVHPSPRNDDMLRESVDQEWVEYASKRFSELLQ